MYFDNKPRKINIINTRIITKIATLILLFIIAVDQLGCVADDKQGDSKYSAGYFCEIACQTHAYEVQDKN
jgi:hypothetical protein